MFRKLLIIVTLLCAITESLTAQDVYPDWYLEDHHYTVVENNPEGNFTMMVIGTIDGVRCDDAYELGVFCKEKNECRSSVPFFTDRELSDELGYFAMPLINGTEGETFYFRLYDHRNQVEVEAEITPEEVPFDDNGVLGDFDNFYELVFKGCTTHRSALTIDDATDLPFSGTQYSITADGIACSYTREAYLDGGYETIVLPFDADITSIKAAGFVFEKFDGFGDNTIRFVELDGNEHLQAGVTYLFRYSGAPSNARQEIKFVAAMDRVDDTIIATQGWAGTFKRMDGNELAGKYILNASGDKMVKAGTGAALMPYHGCLELPAGVNASALSVVHRGNTTGIVNPNMLDGSEAVYDLYGRRLKDMPQEGIVVKCNKKILIK